MQLVRHVLFELSASNLVTYTLFDAAGASLWTDTTTTNIPTAAGREVGAGVTAYKTTAGTVNLIDIDYMNAYEFNALTR